MSVSSPYIRVCSMCQGLLSLATYPCHFPLKCSSSTIYHCWLLGFKSEMFSLRGGRLSGPWIVTLLWEIVGA